MTTSAPGTVSPAVLLGQTILAAEDEPLICLDVEDILRGAGAEVVTAHDTGHAWEIVQTKPVSAAALDIHLGPEPIDPLCEGLNTRGIPFIFSTGDAEAVSPRWDQVAVITKPFGHADLIEALINALIGTHALRQPTEGLARIHEHLFQAQCRIIRQRILLRRLRTAGVDTGAAEELLRLMLESAERMRNIAKERSTTWMAKPTRPSPNDQ